MSDVSQVIITLSAAYPGYKSANPDEMLRLWDRRLSVFDQAVLDAAVETVIDQARYFPSLNEFLKVCQNIRDMRQIQARQDLKQRADETNKLRQAQIDLEQDAADGIFVQEAWQNLAERWRAAGRDYAAEACLDKARQIAKAMQSVYR